MSRLPVTIALFTLLPLITGCAVAAIGAAGTAAVAVGQERTVGEAVDDIAASSEIKSRLLAYGGMGEVDVKTTGGLVLLSGRVISPELRVTAESIAWSTKHTSDVANEIKIETPGGFFSNASDELISARVRARLLGSSTVQARNITVETYGGVVYLMGVTRSAEELEQAAIEASLAGGVNQVVSYMRLRDDRGDIIPYQPGQPAPQPDNSGLMGAPDS